MQQLLISKRFGALRQRKDHFLKYNNKLRAHTDPERSSMELFRNIHRYVKGCYVQVYHERLASGANILLGQKIVVYTDHKNLTYKVFNTERVMRWRLIIEEYGPTLKYVKGSTNIVADALSRLHLEPSLISEADPTVLDTPGERLLAESFTYERLANEVPTKYKTIQREQQKDKRLLQLARKSDNLRIRTFHGGGKSFSLICEQAQIVVPTSLQKRMVEWYHEVLGHPGETRTELTIKQHFTWKNLRKTVQQVCARCDACQRTKRNKKKYGHIPPKQAETIPWETLCIDVIGPYKIKRKTSKSTLYLWALTMIDL